MPMAVGSLVRLFLQAPWTVLLIFMKSEKFSEICKFKKLQHWKLANDLQSAGRKRSWSSTWHLFLKFYNQGSFCNRVKLTYSMLMWDFPSGSAGKKPPAKQGTRVQSLGWKDTLQKKMAAHFSILAWEVPWTEEPGRLPLQSMGVTESQTWLSSWTAAAVMHMLLNKHST